MKKHSKKGSEAVVAETPVKEVRASEEVVTKTQPEKATALVIKRDTLIKIAVGILIAVLLVPVIDWVIQTSITSKYAALYQATAVNRSEYVKELEKQYGQQVIQEMIAKSAVYQAAKDKKITVSDEEVNTAIEADKKRVGITNDEDFKAALDQSGVTMDDYTEYMRLTVTLDKVLDGNVVNPTDAEISDYFAKNATLYTGKKLEEVKDQIRTALVQTAQNTARQKWVTDKLSAYDSKFNLTLEENNKYGFLKSIDLVQRLFANPTTTK